MVMVYEGSALKHLARTRLGGAEPAGKTRSDPPSGRGREPRGPSRNGWHGAGSATSDSADPSPAPETVATCGFCGREFVEDRSQATCQACPLSKGCGLMRCPHCGYENAKEPGWLTRIKEWIR